MRRALAIVALLAAAPAMAQPNPNQDAYTKMHVRPDRGDAQRCMLDAWFRKHTPTSPYLPENGWHNQGEIPCTQWEREP
jgi:hypothetical protein